MAMVVSGHIGALRPLRQDQGIHGDGMRLQQAGWRTTHHDPVGALRPLHEVVTLLLGEVAVRGEHGGVEAVHAHARPVQVDVHKGGGQQRLQLRLGEAAALQLGHGDAIRGKRGRENLPDGSRGETLELHGREARRMSREMWVGCDLSLLGFVELCLHDGVSPRTA
eukprot:1194912-Prorocentrum_minimum.AAC.2